jgi:hypothetical protein
MKPEPKYHIHNTNFFQFQAFYSMAEFIIKQEILKILLYSIFYNNAMFVKRSKVINEIKEYYELCM